MITYKTIKQKSYKNFGDIYSFFKKSLDFLLLFDIVVVFSTKGDIAKNEYT